MACATEVVKIERVAMCSGKTECSIIMNRTSMNNVPIIRTIARNDDSVSSLSYESTCPLR